LEPGDKIKNTTRSPRKQLRAQEGEIRKSRRPEGFKKSSGWGGPREKKKGERESPSESEGLSHGRRRKSHDLGGDKNTPKKHIEEDRGQNELGLLENRPFQQGKDKLG